MIMQVDASIIIIMILFYRLLQRVHRSIWCIYVGVPFRQYIKSFSSNILCKSHFAFLFVFTDVHPFFLFSVSFSFPQFLFHRCLLLGLMWERARRVPLVWEHLFWSLFPVSYFGCNYGAFLEYLLFALMPKNDDSTSVWIFHCQVNLYTAVGAWQKRW